MRSGGAKPYLSGRATFSKRVRMMRLLPLHPRATSLLAVGAAACTLGCSPNYRQPEAEAPHAVIVGRYLGGFDSPKTGDPVFGYQPGVRICKGRETRRDCGKFVPGQLDGRSLTFRVEAGKEITILPLGLIDSQGYNDGVSYGVKSTYCVAEPRTITPQAGDKFEYAYAHDPEKGCGAAWKE